MPIRDIKSNQCVVCLLDILGFRSISRQDSADYIYESRKDNTKNIFLSSRYHASNISEVLDAMFYKFTKLNDGGVMASELFGNTQFQYFGDTVFVIMDLQSFTDKNKLNIIDAFLRFIASFVTLFIVQTKYFMKGGVGFGSYSQGKMLYTENTFCYGESLSKAKDLEEKADVPRIIVSDCLIRYSGDPANSSKLPIIESGDGHKFIDIYEGYNEVGGLKLLDAIKQIRSVVGDQCSRNIKDRKTIEKYVWFQEYHNQKIEEFMKKGLITNKEDLEIKVPYQI